MKCFEIRSWRRVQLPTFDEEATCLAYLSTTNLIRRGEDVLYVVQIQVRVMEELLEWRVRIES